MDAGGGGFYSQEMYERARESGETLMEEAEAIAGEYGTDVTTAMEEGRTAGAIVRYAEDHDIDLIVLGSHGRRGLSRFLLGSVAERVARRSPGSVTIIREEKPERDGSEERRLPLRLSAAESAFGGYT